MQSTDQIPSAEEYAALSFEAWQHEEGEWKPPTNQHWHEVAGSVLPVIRMAWLTQFKTKDEIVEMFATDDDAHMMMDLLDNILAAKAFLEPMVAVAESAHARLLSAACVALPENDET
ncbi:MAG: hypothetical protein MEQ84_08450 [Mesorhizobium sp.]|nr:hypothetical protein [Mesorhizobium sp.]